jgi:hypothetical protein
MQSNILWNEVEELFAKVEHTSLAIVRENIERDARMTLMAAQPGAGFWIKSLWKGRFPSQPALRLFCRTGLRRKATQAEIDTFLGKVSLYRFLKGYDLLWKGMNTVREFEVVRIEGLEAERMNP